PGSASILCETEFSGAGDGSSDAASPSIRGIGGARRKSHGHGTIVDNRAGPRDAADGGTRGEARGGIEVEHGARIDRGGGIGIDLLATDAGVADDRIESGPVADDQ